MPYDTKLSPSDESKFQAWKSVYAPKDSGMDYDLRGAFRAGLSPDPTSGHWPDTFKKPNHPTFSNQSIYAKDAPEKAGTWQGDTYIPPTKPMAYEDDLLNAAQKRTRTGRSFFPAANGQTLIPSRYGTSSAVLPPDQNPAYQAAIARPRLQRNQLTTYTLPGASGTRTVTVPTGSALPSGYAQIEGQPTGNISSPEVTSSTANAPLYTNYAADYAKGFGTPVYPQRQQPTSTAGAVNQVFGNVGSQALRQFSPTVGYQRLGAIGTLAANAFNSLFNRQVSQVAQNPSGYNLPDNPFSGYTDLALSQPRRYSDQFGM